MLVTGTPTVKLLVLADAKSTTEAAGRKPGTGSLSLPAQMKRLKVANAHRVSRVMEYTVVKMLMNAKRNFSASARAATVRTHGEATSVAVVVTICYT